MEMQNAPAYHQSFGQNNAGRIQYSENLDSKLGNWKRRVYWEMSVVAAQSCALVLYLIVFSIALSIDIDDIYNKTTIYTQAIDDWEKPAWVEFSWGDKDGNCNLGSSDDIGYYWLGTLEGNYTDGGVRPVEGDHRAEIPVMPAVMQPFIYESSKAVLCGKRSQYSYRNMTRVKKDPVDNTFKCPDGLKACSG